MRAEKAGGPEPSSPTEGGVVNPLRDLRSLGQSVWLDFISRPLLESGDFERLVVSDHVSGVTSNPTIFQKAMAAGTGYDAQFASLLTADPGLTTGALFEAAAFDDIRAAAAVLRPVYDQTERADGFVSFEVPASLADDTAATIAEARRISKALALPNLMIKVPATSAGIPAIEELIASGINVNITLMFSLGHYEQVAQAYIHGLERCARPAEVASVASFFVSRVDTAVDKALEEVGSPDALALRGRIAVANSKIVYQRFREIFYGAAFATLRARGCRVQRPLWASTSTKNPAYRDVLYVEELIGPDTVNTMPPETIEAFRDHGRVRPTVDDRVAEAREAVLRLRSVGVDLDAITAKLQRDGVASFAQSYDMLISALETKRRALNVARSAH
jgi:transaldolase